MRSNRKRIRIDITYVDRSELEYILSKIYGKVLSNRNSDFKRINDDTFYEFYLTHSIYNDYREEEINGVWYRIYKSKMNE